jgi:hypothetical protein
MPYLTRKDRALLHASVGTYGGAAVARLLRVSMLQVDRAIASFPLSTEVIERIEARLPWTIHTLCNVAAYGRGVPLQAFCCKRGSCYITAIGHP